MRYYHPVFSDWNGYFPVGNILYPTPEAAKRGLIRHLGGGSPKIIYDNEDALGDRTGYYIQEMEVAEND